jgi:glucan phosphoethanolaminetransferase (alkaline phosphatase superfamily)
MIAWTRSLRFASALPVVILAVLDLWLRRDIVRVWRPVEFATYGVSILYALLWVRLVWAALERWESRFPWLAKGFFSLAVALSALIYVTHIGHYLYFHVHPEIQSFVQLFREPQVVATVIGDEVHLARILLAILALLAAATAWKLSRPRLPRLRRPWAWAVAAVILIPVLHKNVSTGQGSYYPVINFVFSFSRAADFYFLKDKQVAAVKYLQRDVPPAVGAPMPHNFLLILSESLSARRLAYYGYERDTTPRQSGFLKRFEPSVVVFQSAYSAAIQSAEAIPSVLTGVHPAEYYRKRMQYPLIYDYAESFQDTFSFLLSSHDFDWWDFRTVLHSDRIDRLIDKDVAGLPEYNHTGSDDRHLVPLLEKTLKEAPPQAGIFGIVHFVGTHQPYRVPETHAHWGDSTILDRYDNAIRHQDEIVGKMLDVLETQGLLRNTIVVFTADHGEGMGEHHVFGHRRTFYEEFVHVPLWVYLPPTVSPALRAKLLVNEKRNVSLVDIVPFFAEVQGIARHPAMAPWLPNLWGKSWTEPLDPLRLLGSYDAGNRTISVTGFAAISGTLRFLMHPIGGVPHVEFYDLANDPDEQRDLWPGMTPAQRQMRIQQVSQIAAFKSELKGIETAGP